MKVVLKLVTLVLTLSGSTHIIGYPSQASLIEAFQDSVAERVVTDYTAVLNGVPVEHGYSECFSEAWLREGSKNGLCSVPGCPKSESGIPWIYYGNKLKCYLAGEKGPCKNFEVLKIVKESPFGICSCKCLDGIIQSLQGENAEVCEYALNAYTFIPKENKCFKLMTEGPCKSNHWLVKSENTSEISCELRTCPEGQLLQMDFNGNLFCDDDLPVTVSAIGGGVQLLKSECPEGSRYSNLLSRCIQKLSFNDEVLKKKLYAYIG